MTLDPRSVARALGGSVTGRNVVVPGPGHSRADRSLSIKIDPAAPDGFIVHSFAGDSPIACRDYVRGALGLGEREGRRLQSMRSRSRPRVVTPDNDSVRRSAQALQIWNEAKDPPGTTVGTYLASRGICLPPPGALRFHAGLKHPSGAIWPAMVALVTNGADGKPIAIHRTFLDFDGEGKAPVDPQKMMLGPCRGGAVRLAAPGDVLMLGEGIETCLAAMQATGHPAWAALSTSGLRALDLPKDVRNVIVLADGDDPGEAAARDCAWRWNREGRRVRIARPLQGMDFNDMLVARAPGIEGGVQ